MLSPYLYLLPILLFANLAQSQNCPLPPAFDEGARYERTLYVHPSGNDATATGEETSPFRTLAGAGREATPGTRIFLMEGEHHPNNVLQRVRGTADAPILITGPENRDAALFRGGGQSMHLIEPAYVVLQNFTVTQGTSNGINIDDGGTFDTPAHHVIMRNIAVRDIQAEGNIDGIKLSGLDHFRIEGCLVDDPGQGGSGIDMVGCHDGVIAFNDIRNCGSSGIQAKGGSARVLIYANRFVNAGMRAINMGGSTGLAFFRPQDAPYEAANITAIANTFVGGDTPIAFVGCVNGLFAHNVVYRPQRWIARILQESTQERFLPCGDSVFANNIVIIDSNVSTLVNIGSNTAPETFRFAHNVIHHLDNPNFRNPSLPGETSGTLVQQDPMFHDAISGDFRLREGSPAVGAGIDLSQVIEGLPIDIPDVGDKSGRCWDAPPTLGPYSALTTASANHWPLDE